MEGATAAITPRTEGTKRRGWNYSNAESLGSLGSRTLENEHELRGLMSQVCDVGETANWMQPLLQERTFIVKSAAVGAEKPHWGDAHRNRKQTC